jgi:hypothetical protein
MRLGVRIGPFWASTGGSSRRKLRRNYTAAQGLFMLALIAVVYLMVSGGWWVVFGWTLFAVTIVVAQVCLGKRALGVQHAGGSESMHYSDRR